MLFLDHDFATGETHKFTPDAYAASSIKDDKIGYKTPTFISIRSGKQDKSCAASHADGFERIQSLQEFKIIP